MHANIFIVGRHKLNGTFIIVTSFKTQKGLSEAVHAPAGPGSVRPQETTLWEGRLQTRRGNSDNCRFDLICRILLLMRSFTLLVGDNMTYLKEMKETMAAKKNHTDTEGKGSQTTALAVGFERLLSGIRRKYGTR